MPLKYKICAVQKGLEWSQAYRIQTHFRVKFLMHVLPLESFLILDLHPSPCLICSSSISSASPWRITSRSSTLTLSYALEAKPMSVKFWPRLSSNRANCRESSALLCPSNWWDVSTQGGLSRQKVFTLNIKYSSTSWTHFLYELAIDQKRWWSSSWKVRVEPKRTSRFHNYAFVSNLLRRPSPHLSYMVPSIPRPKLFSWRDYKAIQSLHTSWHPSSYSKTGHEYNWTQSVVRCIRIRRLSWCVSFRFWIEFGSENADLRTC